MTKKELTRVYFIKSLIEDKMESRDTAEVLSLSERQIKRLKAGVKKEESALLERMPFPLGRFFNGIS